MSIKENDSGAVLVVAFPDQGLKKLLAEYAGLEKVEGALIKPRL